MAWPTKCLVNSPLSSEEPFHPSFSKRIKDRLTA
jgi:hypothetical protein